ncbi:MAG: AAA family ATPase [Candidatus Moraniibacteriota bacterium]
MFVKKIELCGFKSFAQKTIFDFNRSEEVEKSGIACIVGPNGSGKSNVADALRWVIGEKSAKNLRGKKSEDVIFAGSDKKSQLGSARVSIYFDNTDKKFNLDYPEVVVTRKIFRSGENQYLINGSKVRLTDIVELLSQAGIGKESYAIINQGMADRILSASPAERRNILEESAGIKEFQIKKNRSLKKIAKTEENLSKVKNSLSELIPDLKTLERQKNKIEKSRYLREQLKEKKVEYFAALWSELTSEILEKEKEFEEIRIKTEKEKEKIFAIKNRISNFSYNDKSTNKETDSLEKEKSRLEQEIYNLQKDLSILEGKIEIEKQKKRSLEKPEFIPVNKKYTLEKLYDIKEDYTRLNTDFDKNKQVDLNEIKSFLKQADKKVDNLIKGIQDGKVKKFEAGEEIKKQEKQIDGFIEEYTKEVLDKKSAVKEKQDRIKEIQKQVAEIQSKERSQKEEELQAKDELRRKEFELEKASGYQNHIHGVLKQKKKELAELQEKIRKELGKKPEKLSQSGKLRDSSFMEKEIEKINWQLEQIGGIDESVIKEFDETQKRYNFLKKESVDLEETLKSLNEIVEEMNVVIRKRFEKAFEEVNKNFGSYFEKIFGGGKAFLKKVRSISEEMEGDDDGEEKETNKPGIEIEVFPPGKKIKSLGMLSGGERSLTSVALLFAIIAHNPPPFAFMDEIEANLDDANSLRLSHSLKELSTKTQFILATHNKQTMKQASFLYGVSMQEDGCSRVYSLKLD